MQYISQKSNIITIIYIVLNHIKITDDKIDCLLMINNQHLLINPILEEYNETSQSIILSKKQNIIFTV